MSEQRLINSNADVYKYVETWTCNCSECGVQNVMAVDDISTLPEIDPETLPIVRELRAELERVTAEKNAAINDLLQVGRGYDFCTVCAHCCEGGKPKYRPQEPYMEFCKKCNDDYSQFEWRDSWDGKNGE